MSIAVSPEQDRPAIPYVKIGPVKWLYGHEVADFTKSNTYWIFGKRFVGKSSLSEAILTNHLRTGATGFDIFSARDSESLAWLRSPYRNSVLLFCGNSINLKCKYPWRHAKDLTLEEAETYKLVVTSPRFYSTEGEQFGTLSNIVDKLKWRTNWNRKGGDKIDVLLIREAARFLASRQYAGKVKNKMEAEHEMIDLLQESYHTGVSVIVDSLRPNSIDINIREIANYVFIKRMGRLSIPREFYFLMRYVDPNKIRTMDIDKFVLYTDNDNIAIGKFNEVPWHVKRGEDILKMLDIEVQKNEQQPLVTEDGNQIAEDPTENWIDNRVKMTRDLHETILLLKKQGNTYIEIMKALPVKVSPSAISIAIRAHQAGNCKVCAE